MISSETIKEIIKSNEDFILHTKLTPAKIWNRIISNKNSCKNNVGILLMTNKISRLNRLFKKYEVILAYLFGSQKDSGLKYIKEQEVTIEETSDLDIGILLKNLPVNTYKLYGNLYYDLSTIFEPFNIDIVFLHEVNSLLKFEIIKGPRIYTSDEKFADEYEDNVMKFASDLSFKRKMFEEDFLEALENGYFEIELK